jgi:hypothetical protein
MIVKTKSNPREIFFNLPIRYCNKKGRGDLNKKLKKQDFENKNDESICC